MSTVLETIDPYEGAPSKSLVYIENWDEYFHSIADAVAQKSKDPRCRVGAVVVSPDKLVLATGFNGLARGVIDDETLLENIPEKLTWICHAEANAILNAARMGISLRDSCIYVNKFPCFACCNSIVQAGIKEIYTHDSEYWDDDPFDKEHTRKPVLLNQGGVKVKAPNHPTYSWAGGRI